jgi:8-oxo-dGTP pyrophosphatase MutT (NUDIX family)
MIIHELFCLMDNDDHLHARALQQTGFWGAQAAGCIFLARDSKRFLLSHRSMAVEQPGTWGTWGGAIDRGEDPEAAARREAVEEAGHDGHITMVPLYVFRKDTFRYSNFLAIVDREFKPTLNWETQGFRWCPYGDWPHRLHFGLTAVLNDAASVATIKRVIAELR